MPVDASQSEPALRVRHSTRARRTRVTVDATGVVEVVLPSRLPARAAQDAVRELRPWIDRRRSELEAARRELDGTPGRIGYL
nr:DUF45 domain-containing protein [Solirubrobacterales bacterium]